MVAKRQGIKNGLPDEGDDDNEVQPPLQLLLLYLCFPVTSVVVVASLSIALPRER
jgi:hypothetical protein